MIGCVWRLMRAEAHMHPNQDAIYMAIESGEREALQEVVEEARDMVNGQKLRTLWEHLDQGPGQPRPMEEDVYPEEDTVQKLSAEAEGMEVRFTGCFVCWQIRRLQPSICFRLTEGGGGDDGRGSGHGEWRRQAGEAGRGHRHELQRVLPH